MKKVHLSVILLILTLPIPLSIFLMSTIFGWLWSDFFLAYGGILALEIVLYIFALTDKNLDYPEYKILYIVKVKGYKSLTYGELINIKGVDRWKVTRPFDPNKNEFVTYEYKALQEISYYQKK